MTELERPEGQFLVYADVDGRLKIDVRLDGAIVWLTQQGMAELFQTSVPNINMHVKNVYDEGELVREGTVQDFLTVRQEGGREVRRNLTHYNLDVIISVGYRVRSHVATQFRMWATERLREYIVKGFVLDDERLKNPDQPFDYFDELLRRIQDIRTSEQRFYQKITDIYATSIDYDPTLEVSLTFFKTVQNKMHWAISGKTAAEIIRERADADLPNMGLTTWRGATIRKSDVGIAKNYLGEDELAALNNLVEQYLVPPKGRPCAAFPCTWWTGWQSSTASCRSTTARSFATRARSHTPSPLRLRTANTTSSRRGGSRRTTHQRATSTKP